MVPELKLATKTKYIAIVLILFSTGFFRMGFKAMGSSASNDSEYMPPIQKEDDGNKTAMYFGFTAGVVLLVAGIKVWRIE